MPTAEERLAAIAERISPCPAPDVLAGYDQCTRGTWPCAITEAAWLAQGRDREQELRDLSQEVAREAAIEDAGREAWEEYRAARSEGSLPDREAEIEAG
jgi:hypothetical protein